jgi:hypothetical protein
MKIESRIIFFLICILITACAGLESRFDKATPAPWEPLTSDAEMQRVEIEQLKVEIVPRESDPSLFALRVEGALPTPCHQLRVKTSTSDVHSSLDVEIYAIVDPNEICIQILEPFSEEIPLDEGEYQLVVNNEVVGEVPP